MFVKNVCLIGILLGSGSLVAQECKSLGDSTPEKIKRYIASRVVSNDPPTIDLTSSEPVIGTCYLKLTIHASTVAHPVTLFLSPDRRFLSNSLFDLDAPPTDAALSADSVATRFANEPSPQLGSAKHVLVEFGDFQCPFCGDLARWYKELPTDLKNQYSLVFKHLPLPQHPWAMQAAELMACVQKESPTAFWPTYSYVYESQRDITETNLKEKILGNLTKLSAPKQNSISACFTTHGAADLVKRDTETAAALHITSTPTVYLDGYRILALRSEEEFSTLLKKKVSIPQ